MSDCKSANNVAVAFATKDDVYVYYMYITIFSILLNAQKNTYYDFYILVSGGFSEKSKNYFRSLAERFRMCSFTFINLSDAFQSVSMTHDHINYPTYFRLLLADVLPNLDKCLYLDTDIVVEKDLFDFYNLNIDDYYLAGVRAAGYQINAPHNVKRLALPEVKNYFNAGVILLNLKKIREDNLTSRFMQLMDMNYHDQDQDILNVACYGKVKILPFKYNMMTKYESIFDQCIQAQAYTQEEITEAIKDPIIIHYADKIKPWQNPDVYFGEIWWSYARQTSFYERILFFNMKKCLSGQQNIQYITQQTIKQIKGLDENFVRDVVLFSKKNFTYFRYKWLSKILKGKKGKKYKEKFNVLKSKIKSVQKFCYGNNEKSKKKTKVSFKSKIVNFMEKHKFSKDILDLVLLLEFLLKKKKKEKLEKVEKIKFITCRYPVRQAGGGQGAALTMNETVLDKSFKGIPIEFVYETENKYSKKKHLGPYFDYAGFVFARKMTQNDKNTVYVTHEEETGFGLWLMGKRYVIFSHVQGSRLEEKINNGEKLSWVSKQIIKFVEKMAFKHALFVCFPAKGAYECYLKSPYKGAEKSDFKLGPIVYNTLYLNHTPEKYKGIEKDPEALTFLSIGGLTAAKGIDRAVDVIEEVVKITPKKVRYLINGKGILQDVILEKLNSIEAKYPNFSYKLINRSSVGELPYLQEISDVYIMLQRISIFDLATLEMMNKSKTIVLSDIGGNLEFNKMNNIIFWNGNNIDTAERILKLNLSEQGKLNKVVYDKYFSHVSYKKAYDSLLEKLLDVKNEGN